MGASTCWNPQGLSRPVMGLLYLYLKEKDHWGDPDIGGRIILIWIFRK
jgi:hypothetical protein